jgi:hypothetical protein
VISHNPDLIASKARRLDAESSMRLKRPRAKDREHDTDWLSQDDNAATAPGQVCELCGSVITAGQEARLRFDGWWIHEACPIQ